ncbi:TonB-dependent receptor [Lysobacteraceae bacterium NML07-0707]|nr:TonB-dependent receptor [Xanthomonadaceae bacterium NML07-0707]
MLLRTPLAIATALALLPAFAHAQSKAHPSSRQLDRIIVTATRSTQTVAGVPASASVIEHEELQQHPVLDMADALRGLPGVNLQGIGQARRGISVRGLDPGYTLTLVDGLRVNSSGNVMAHSDFDFGWVPVEAIERIEFVRGPMSSLYGSDALGGVVNLITRSATDAWHGSSSLNAGWRKPEAGGDWWQASAYAAGPLLQDTLGLSVFAESRNQDKGFDAFNPAITRFEGRKARTGSAMLSWTPDAQQRIDLRVLAGKEARNRHVALGGPRPSTYETLDTLHRRLHALSHRGQWDWGQSRVYAMRATLDKDNWRSKGARQGRQKMRDDNIGGHASFTIGDHHQLSLGGEWRRETIEDALVNLQGRDQSVQRALFWQDEIRFTPHWSLVIGSRHDHHDRFGSHHSPRVYLTHDLGHGWTLKGGAGRGFRAPSLKQMSPEYTATIAGSFVLHGNPQLQPETSTSYEIAANWQGTHAHLDMAVFDNRLDNLIQSVCIANCNIRRQLATRTYQNIAHARTRGFEVSAQQQIGKAWRIAGSYTYVDARDLSQMRKLRLRPHHNASASLRWQPLATLAMTLRGEYIGKQVDYPTRGPLQHIPGGTRWHLDGRWQASPALAVRAGIENIGNARQNLSELAYPYPEFGRSVHIGLNLSF